MGMRPATPLSVLFLVAFALLLLSSLSTPVIKAIPLASHKGYTFGVWGYCNGDDCSKIGIGYDMKGMNGLTKDDFSLPEGTRNSLAAILVIHPVAAFLALVCTVLAISLHFHAPSHSPRFMLGLFILTIPTFLAALLSFLVDILIFIPHVSWGGWVCVASTVLIAISGLVTCGMRRSLVSRKARRKRIQENAEMNGQNYFESMAAKQAGMDNVAVSVVSDLPRAESPPPLTGGSTAPLNDKSQSTFGTYDSTPLPEDKIPLRMNNAPPAMGGAPGYGGPPRSTNGSIPRQVDQFGNPIVPMAAMGRPSMESNRSNRSNPAFYGGNGRGRGGYPPNNGRGGYPPRGGPMMRGGPGMRGGYRPRGGPNMGPPGPMMGRGGPPPPGYGQQDRYYEQPGQRGISPSYDQGQRGMSPAGLGRQNSPPQMAIGQALEMDEHNGVPSPALSPVNTTPPNEYQQPPPQARQQWASRPPPPNGSRALSPIEASPIDSTSKYSQTQAGVGGHRRTPSGSYYEDVEPRFAPEEPVAAAPAIAISQQPPPPQIHMTASSMAVPGLLAPGGPQARGIPQGFNTAPPPEPLDALRQESQESLQEGQRSPATSDTSHFTSVSQRGINPRWPGNQQATRMGPPPPQQQPRPSDVLLNSNPDFSLPGMGPRPGRGGGGGGGGRMGPGRQSPAMGMGGLGQPSRYPMGPPGSGI